MQARVRDFPLRRDATDPAYAEIVCRSYDILEKSGLPRPWGPPENDRATVTAPSCPQEISQVLALLPSPEQTGLPCLPSVLPVLGGRCGLLLLFTHVPTPTGWGHRGHVVLDSQTRLDIGGTPGPLPSDLNRYDERGLTFAFSDRGGGCRIWETLSCPQCSMEALADRPPSRG